MFVWFLWSVFIVDLIGFYAAFTYFNNYRIFGFIKGTVFENNYWLFNSFKIISFSVYIFFFIKQLYSLSKKRILSITLVFFVLSAIINLIFSNAFFTSYITYTTIWGTFLLLICIGLYFFEILNSDRIIRFYRSLPFYIAIGALIWHLCVTPLFIYSNFFQIQSPDFVHIYGITLGILNWIMYGSYIVGFFMCINKS